MQSELRHSLSQRLMQTHADPPTNPLQHLYSLLSTDSSVGVMGGLDTRINASPMDYPVTWPVTWLWSVTGSGPQSVTWIAIRSRGRGHVIAIINWPGPQSGTWSSRFCLQSSVCQARPKDIIPGCPFRQVITIINITYINIGVCCSVIKCSM